MKKLALGLLVLIGFSACAPSAAGDRSKIENHANTVFKVLNAAQAEKGASASEIFKLSGDSCMKPKTVISYTWPDAPAGTVSCTIGLTAAQDDYVVTVVGDGPTGRFTYRPN